MAVTVAGPAAVVSPDAHGLGNSVRIRRRHARVDWTKRARNTMAANAVEPVQFAGRFPINAEANKVNSQELLRHHPVLAYR